jgi:hypothetical protein
MPGSSGSKSPICSANQRKKSANRSSTGSLAKKGPAETAAICRLIAATLCIWGAALWPTFATGGASPGPEPEAIHIECSQLPGAQGYVYRLAYVVDVPLEIYWKFKTDFDNDFLVSNPLISAHRLLRRDGDTVVTETTYTTKPDTTFRWQTTVRADKRQLDFKLLNASEVDQEFHHGWIQLMPLGDRTRVIQSARFNFFGAYFWVNYPWYGGLSYFLKHTVEWEKTTVRRLSPRYID